MPTRDLRNFGALVDQIAARREMRKANTAEVYAIDLDRVEIRMLNSSVLIKHVEVLGNVEALSVGDLVEISWYQGRPRVVGMVGDSSLLSILVDNVTIENVISGLQVKDGGIGLQHLNFVPALEGHTHAELEGGAATDLGKILLISDEIVTEYDPTPLGLQDALDASISGDLILLPPSTFDENIVIPSGVVVVGHSRYGTRITAKVTGGASSAIENLTVYRSTSSIGAVAGIDISEAGTFYVHNCDIVCENSGSGAAYGVSCNIDGGQIHLWNSYMYGDATSGVGYGTYRDTDIMCAIVVFGGWIRGSTNPCNE